MWLVDITVGRIYDLRSIYPFFCTRVALLVVVLGKMNREGKDVGVSDFSYKRLHFVNLFLHKQGSRFRVIRLDIRGCVDG